MDGGISLFHAGLTLGGARDLFSEVPGHGRVSFLNSPGTFYFGNLTGPRRQVYHRQRKEHEQAFVPGLGRRSVTVMMRTGLFPYNHSRIKDRIPDTPALWACLKNLMVESMLDPSIRLPTLEEVMQETHARCGATAAAALHQAAADAPSQAEEPPVSSPKRRRLRGNTNRFVA